MNNIYKSNSNFNFKYYTDISLIETEYEPFLQKCFLQSFITNDIDIKNSNYNYKTYLKNDPILLVFNTKGEVRAFILFKYLPNIKALDFNTYVCSKCSIKELKIITQEGLKIYAYIAKDLYPDLKMYYFNVSHKIFFSWIKPILHTGKMIKIRKQYYICYGFITKEFIEKIILKNVEIIKC